MGEAKRRKLLDSTWGKQKESSKALKEDILEEIKEEKLIVMSLLKKEQKVFFAFSSLNEPCLESSALAQIITFFFETYGRGIFCPENGAFAYVPAGNLRKSQTGLKNLVEKYDPKTQIICYTPIAQQSDVGNARILEFSNFLERTFSSAK